MVSSELEAKLAEIKQAYQSELPNKVMELKQAWKRLQDEDWGADRLQELHRMVHSLAGSGATFGFQDISSHARKLEIELKALLQAKANNTATFESRIGPLLDTLLNTLTAASSERSASRAAALNVIEEAADSAKILYVLSRGETNVLDLCDQLEYYGFKVVGFNDNEALAAALARQLPDAIILALDPDDTILNLIRPVALQMKVPTLVVADRFDLNIRLAAVRAGCSAYFTWPLDASVLAGRIDQLSEQQNSEPYRILIVEDDVDLAKHYAAVLRDATFDVRVVNKPLQALHTLAEYHPELILMDVYMPDCSGVELAAVIRQEDAYVSVPIVYLSTETDLAKQIDAMRQGGDEFLTKPIEPHLLVASVRCRVQRSRVLSSFLRRDSLTGLLNHTSTKESLETEVERARRRGTPFSFAMIDIDRFKSINDTHGHPVGDRVIKNLARLLQQRLRKTDVIGRFGGEEFALVLPDTALEYAVPVLDELRESFENIRQTFSNTEFRVSFSCGITAYPRHQNADDILFHADAALYKAKHQGRNRVVVAD